MTYSVKEIFYTLQGEGLRAGRPAVFCRFSGCNLWSGREVDRTTLSVNFAIPILLVPTEHLAVNSLRPLNSQKQLLRYGPLTKKIDMSC